MVHFPNSPTFFSNVNIIFVITIHSSDGTSIILLECILKLTELIPDFGCETITRRQILDSLRLVNHEGYLYQCDYYHTWKSNKTVWYKLVYTVGFASVFFFLLFNVCLDFCDFDLFHQTVHFPVTPQFLRKRIHWFGKTTTHATKCYISCSLVYMAGPWRNLVTNS